METKKYNEKEKKEWEQEDIDMHLSWTEGEL